MIGAYLQPLKSQSDIVKYVKGSLVDEGATHTETKKAMQYAVGSSYIVTSWAGLSYTQIQEYIVNGRPLGATIEWNSGNGCHVVVFSGYTYDKKITVIDPWYNCATQNYEYAKLINGVTLQSGTGKCILIRTVD